MNVEVVKIDNKEYMILNQVIDNSFSFFYLSNVEDPNDIVIRKADNNDLDILMPLDNKEEVDRALTLLNN